MSEKLVLALDGATRTSSAAVLRRRPAAAPDDWEVLARRAESDARGQAKILLRSMDEMLTSLGAQPGDLEGIVVGTGPGTFTGVRIAVATARGLALSLGIPVVGISTIAVLAAAVVDSEITSGDAERTCLVPIVDARRQQVFYAMFDKREMVEGADRGGWMRTGPIEVCGQERFGEKLTGIAAENVVVIGEKRGLVGELPEKTAFVEQPVAAEFLVVCQGLLQEPGDAVTAKAARLWLSRAGQSTGADLSPEHVKPLYVRAPDADAHITKMKDPWGDGN